MHGTPASLYNPVCVVLGFSISDSDLSCHFMRYGLRLQGGYVKPPMCCLCPKRDKYLGKLQLRTHCLRKLHTPRKSSHDWNITFYFNH